MGRTGAIRAVAAAIGVFNTALGFWAFIHPSSFFSRIATFPPYNRHLVHDIGAFQVGLGAVLLLSLVWKDGLLVALAGAAAGFILHFFSHLFDRELGGRVTDPVTIGLLMVVVVMAAAWRAQDVGSEQPPPPSDSP